MAFDLKQSLRLSQQLLMTPQLQQAIKLLQLSRLELEKFVTSQLEENPVLEEGIVESSEERVQTEMHAEKTEEQAINDHMESATGIVDKVSGENSGNELDWESYSKSHESAAPTSSTSKSRDEEAPNYENIITKARSLQEHLMAQVGELDFDETEKKIASVIVGNIDDRGYLQTSIEEIANLENFDIDLIEGVLDTVQRLDPLGVGARDLKECLQLQVRLGNLRDGVVEMVIEHHLTDLETRNYQAIAKALKVPLERIFDSVEVIAELEPIPGRQFGSDATQYIVPDVYVFKLGGEWTVSLNEEGLPRLKISSMYKDMASSGKQASGDKAYLQDKLKSAVWLIKSIQQRQRTIFKVTECIVKRQKEFFEMGVEHLKPMILKDIAEDIGMHESTISRVTSNKYLHSPRGILELKYFFNSSVMKSDGESVASESVKRMIDELVKVEDTKRPLSDQRIVELLEEKGIQLARRTVAKYREQLGIAPSSRRKRFF